MLLSVAQTIIAVLVQISVVQHYLKRQLLSYWLTKMLTFWQFKLYWKLHVQKFHWKKRLNLTVDVVECEDVGQPSHGLQKAVQMFFRESDRQHVSEDTATLREKQKGVHHERVTDFISRSISVVTVHVISSTYPYSNFYNFVDLFNHMLIICTGLLIFLNFESDCLLTLGNLWVPEIFKTRFPSAEKFPYFRILQRSCPWEIR